MNMLNVRLIKQIIVTGKDTRRLKHNAFMMSAPLLHQSQANTKRLIISIPHTLVTRTV